MLCCWGPAGMPGNVGLPNVLPIRNAFCHGVCGWFRKSNQITTWSKKIRPQNHRGIEVRLPETGPCPCAKWRLRCSGWPSCIWKNFHVCMLMDLHRPHTRRHWPRPLTAPRVHVAGWGEAQPAGAGACRGKGASANGKPGAAACADSDPGRPRMPMGGTALPGLQRQSGL